MTDFSHLTTGTDELWREFIERYSGSVTINTLTMSTAQILGAVSADVNGASADVYLHKSPAEILADIQTEESGSAASHLTMSVNELLAGIVSGPAGPSLGALTLNTSTVVEGTAAGVLVGTLQGVTGGSTLSITDTAGSRFAIDGNTVETGTTETNYSIATSHNVTVRETLAGSPNSPRDSVIAIAVTEVGYSAEADALFARFTTPPTVARKQQIDTLIAALKAGGVWAKLDALYIMAAANAQAAQRNWKQDLYNLNPVVAPTFTADRGYQGNGTTQYLDTGFVPSTAGGLYTQNSASFGVWSRTDGAATFIDMGTRIDATTAQSLLQVRSTSNLVHRINQSANGSALTNSNGIGHFVANRSGASVTSVFRAGVAMGSGGTIASDALSSNAFTICAVNGAAVGGFSTRQYAAAQIGGSLTPAEALAGYNALSTYMVAVGAA